MTAISRIAPTLLVLACIGLAAADASAHLKERGQWVFRGSTYKEKGGKSDDRKDPINVIFYRGGGNIDNDRVNAHLNEDWDTGRVGGRGWRKHDDITHACKVDQYVFWPFYPGSDEDRTDQHGSTARSKYLCTSQHHGRLWDDQEHARGSSTHSQGSWVIGGFHHDKPRIKRCYSAPVPGGQICTVTHVPDRDWDFVRAEVKSAMHKHCSQLRWDHHIGADQFLGGYDNSGYIARISMHHVADGGCSGQ